VASVAAKKSLPMLDSRGMVEEFQCPGCLRGSDTSCGAYKPSDQYGHRCEAHVCGTYIMGTGSIALGLPKGFNRPGRVTDPSDTKHGGWQTLSAMLIRLWPKDHPEWDKMNVAVWAMVKEGFLFVRTWMPRTNYNAVDVVQGGTLDMVPQAINVGEFADEID
jgi:hypothetical protein